MRLFLALALTLAACSAPPGDEPRPVEPDVAPLATSECPSHRYRLRVSTTLSATQRALILEAFRSWEALTPGAFSFEEDVQTVNAETSSPCVIAFLAGEPPKGYLGWTEGAWDERGRTKFANVTFNKFVIDPVFRMVVRHEAGHTLGMRHNEDPKSIMFHDPEENAWVSREDMIRLLDIWEN